MMQDKLRNILACPECKGELKSSATGVSCNLCNRNFKVSKGVPIFLNSLVEDESAGAGSFKDEMKNFPGRANFFRKVRRVLGPPDPNFRDGAEIVSRIAKKSKLILNIGSSSVKKYSSSINVDIGLYDNLDVVADGAKLPFKSESFDLVIIEMVLEHVKNPSQIVKEAYRVVKKGGLVYTSIPFVYVFHGSPDDYNRYTIHGLEEALKSNGFKIKESGMLSGPSCTVSQMLRYYLAMLFSFNSLFLFSVFLNIFGWLTFPIKYLDYLVMRHKKASLIASTIYSVGRK